MAQASLEAHARARGHRPSWHSPFTPRGIHTRSRPQTWHEVQTQIVWNGRVCEPPCGPTPGVERWPETGQHTRYSTLSG
eukprot:5358450-Prymnesium_polylepis.2